MFRNRKKPKIIVSKDMETVTITFPTGEKTIVDKHQISERANYNVDDNITRSAYKLESFDFLSQTGHLPRSIYCPISRMPMRDPVLCADGYSYERTDIKKWMQKSNISPYTGQTLQHKLVVPNHALRSTITEILERG